MENAFILSFLGAPLFFMLSNTSLKVFGVILHDFGLTFLHYFLSNFGSHFASLLYFLFFSPYIRQSILISSAEGVSFISIFLFFHSRNNSFWLELLSASVWFVFNVLACYIKLVFEVCDFLMFWCCDTIFLKFQLCFFVVFCKTCVVVTTLKY